MMMWRFTVRNQNKKYRRNKQYYFRAVFQNLQENFEVSESHVRDLTMDTVKANRIPTLQSLSDDTSLFADVLLPFLHK